MRRYFIIDKYNTWYDWRLTLTDKSIADAEPKYNYIALDGVSGTLDYTEALTGEVEYNDRAVSASFMCSEGTHKEREALLKTITAALHGKKVKLTEPDDPDSYFLGRVKIKSAKNHPAYLEFILEATCDPWRYAVNETERFVQVAGAADVVIRNDGGRTVCPVINVTGTIVLVYNGITTSLTDGSYKITDIKLKQGVNVIGLDGSGSVTFVYREAGL